MAAVVLDAVIVLQGDGEVVVHRLVVEEIVLDDVPFVAEAEDELAQAVMGEDLHDVPQDRPAPDLHHRFGAKLGLLAQTGADAAA